jgi:hypothetical protein
VIPRGALPSQRRPRVGRGLSAAPPPPHPEASSAPGVANLAADCAVARTAAFVALFVTALGAARCVVPIGPRFDEAEPLAAPHVVNAVPAAGSVVSKVEGQELPSFEVFLSDPNVRDVLYGRIIYNFPPFEPNTRWRRVNDLTPAANLGERRGAMTFRPNCVFDNLPRGIKQHRVMLVIADRPFLEDALDNRPAEEAIVALPDDARTTRVQWLLNMECQ